ncbi:MAG: S46 family peptidase [Chitinophagia bacterium]|nr:S46 family peptidase [Chitinophagia bacterium]
MLRVNISVQKMYSKAILAFFFYQLFSICPAMARGGMWLPALLNKQEPLMREMGLEIPASAIYNRAGTGLNNAVVQFGSGCTGEIISKNGLLLTNHHCAYGTVQGLSSPEKDYFANGFFAKTNTEELPCPGLTVTITRKVEDVTNEVLNGIPDIINDSEREVKIAERIHNLEEKYKTQTGLDALIQPYYNGNQYWVSIREVYKDIRLVAFPPNSIGSFGGDDENWVWPRHTGDFSMFRIYVNTENQPAPYSASNVPFQPQVYFTLNAHGYHEGDFTMVYGYPGSTQEYISSYELKHVYQILDPISIEARTKKLDVWTKHMDADRNIFLKYTSKRAGVANGWKKWQGEVRGLEINKAAKKKRKYEAGFQKWASAQNAFPYADTLLPALKRIANNAEDLLFVDRHINEDLMAIELLQVAANGEKMLAAFRKAPNALLLEDSLKKYVTALDGFYKNYDPATDQALFEALMPLYIKNCKKQMPDFYVRKHKLYKKNYKKWAKVVFQNSIFANGLLLKRFAENAYLDDSNKLINDPGWQLFSAIANYRKQNVTPGIQAYYKQKRYLNRLYMKAQMAYDTAKDFFPDANFTLRLAYGNVSGLKPDGKRKKYQWQTNIDDVVAHHNPSVSWYNAPFKLIDLHDKKDYGRWKTAEGTVPVAFVATNHTTGGNSGSPVLNSKGELIGTNFDRTYEGTMSDYWFDLRRCRNIAVDIRYTLFIIDKFGGAGRLLNEMTIVE